MYKTYRKSYFASAGDNKVVAAGKAILHRIIIGADVASGDMEISDHASDGDGNIVMQLTGSTLMTANGGGVEVGALFENGICMDLINQTKVTVIWEPVAQ